MSEEKSRRVVERVWQEIVVDGDLDAVDELVAPEYVYHGPGGREIEGPDGFRRFIGELHAMSRTVDVTVHEYITEGGRVLSRWTGHARLEDDQELVWSGATITHVADGRIVEDWEYWDRLSLADQLADGWLKERLVGTVVGGVEDELPSG